EEFQGMDHDLGSLRHSAVWRRRRSRGGGPDHGPLSTRRRSGVIRHHYWRRLQRDPDRHAGGDRPRQLAIIRGRCWKPIAADDVAAVTADVALAASRHGIVEIAGRGKSWDDLIGSGSELARTWRRR